MANYVMNATDIRKRYLNGANQLRELWARIWDEIDPKYSTAPDVIIQRGDSYAR